MIFIYYTKYVYSLSLRYRFRDGVQEPLARRKKL